MSWQIIKQPDGKLGVYSSDVSNWIAKDMTSGEVEELFAEDMGADIARRLRRVRQNIQYVTDDTPEKAYYQFAMTYEEACQRPDDEEGEIDNEEDH